MKTRVAVIQTSSIPTDAMACAAKGASLVEQAAANGAKLVVFPEAFLGGYPKGCTFGAPVGTRKPEGRDAYATYYHQAVSPEGPEVAMIIEAARRADVFVVLGCIERDGGTLYCTVLFIDGKAGLAGKHRKLMPTGAERLIWGFGDGSTMPTFETPAGRVGAVICWENYMPMLRMYMYSQGIAIYCAPTADDRDTWLPSMQHIALEGRCYVLSACQYLRRDAYPEDFECVLADGPDSVLLRGGSAIIDPLGRVLAGPDFTGETILYADIDPNEITRGKFDFDVTGHYARPDVFQLGVDTRPKSAVQETGRCDGGQVPRGVEGLR
ncbi:Nitrilase [Paraburkholderia nemoris]|uniref:carbon-nitrogen hydrolase family protein n=1 Tax=Paraburkholderia nemoris TaxID=2793076 RepID=UPI00190A5DC4|nr:MULTISPECIES: carbon-nitrogen hydrolase family protein [Paraburkholderia]MBK3786747.1 carbon-nitrogen hydrolase family protein [Paraburkholderia aspalathi]CAE6863461.1 Nitrilase [Paraburkholderia nemoris]